MDYIPKTQAAKLAWLVNFATVLATAYAAYGVTSGEASQITALVRDCSDAYTTATAPETRTKPTVAALTTAFATAIVFARPIAQRIAVNSNISPEQKVTVGVNPRTSMPSPIPAPTIAPTLGTLSAIPGQLTIAATNPVSGKRGKPEGTVATEIATSIGTAFTADPTEAKSQGQFTRGRINLAIAPEASGMKVSVFARYRTRSGPGGNAQVGPWSTPLQLVAP